MTTIRTAARAIIRHEGRLLVIRYRDERGDRYALPGGGQRHREGMEAALIREVAEETGASIRVGPLRFVRECIAGPGDRALPPEFHQVELFFECTLERPFSTDTRGQELDPDQEGVEWRGEEELRQLCFFPRALLDAFERGQEFGYLGVV
ncbi:NUDIX domain-containing protein [Archangium violaceum]|uniref:NUDIX domain-containing protein n=1 Tax=Archangium violaceum TaxID=83451 RepID=UPI0019511884|nr:NUDIX domain-containing protein [Archangium violaceum]QRN96051.1 NUDIX domain-containing protein [Archangium violaceum]